MEIPVTTKVLFIVYFQGATLIIRIYESLAIARRTMMKSVYLNLYVKLQNLMSRDEGQDLVEYALVVALIAFGATAGMQSLAGGINTAFSNINTVLGNYTV
jgi:pilus assembly protein Flp/PilA